MKSFNPTFHQAGLTRGVGVAALAVALLLSVAVPPAGAADARKRGPTFKRVFPPTPTPYGATYGEWAAAWWQWALETPGAVNPVSDTTGEFCGVNQQGPVWFLAGTTGGDVVRECTVPADKGIFFPLINTLWIQFPEDEDLCPDEIRAILRPGMDDVTLNCEVDGVPIRNLQAYREESVAFDLDIPDDNLFSAFGLPGGSYTPNVDTGYYVMLEPLKHGKHTIHFSAVNNQDGFALDVTYHLNVMKAKKPSKKGKR